MASKSSSPTLPRRPGPIDAKLGDETCLWSNRDETADGNGSVAIGTFACHRPNENVQATMQISMQIPYRGSEFLPASMRRIQASEKLTFGVHLQLEAHELLLKSQCEHAPQVLGLRRGKQDEDGLVPGGSVVYVVLGKVPGVVLGESTVTWHDGISTQDGIFWHLEREKRDKIRDAFEVAYRSLSQAGVSCSCPRLDHLSWDESSAKIYFFGSFEPYSSSLPSRPVFTVIPWGPRVLYVWSLVIPPKGRLNVDVVDMEKSGWRL